MSDGITPRCFWCGEMANLAEHMEHLDAHQGLIERRLERSPGLEFRVGAICRECREDPERCCFDGPPAIVEEVADEPPF